MCVESSRLARQQRQEARSSSAGVQEGGDRNDIDARNDQAQSDERVANRQPGDCQSTPFLPRLLDLIERDVPQDYSDDGEDERADQTGDGEAVSADSHRRGVLLRIALRRRRIAIGLRGRLLVAWRGRVSRWRRWCISALVLWWILIRIAGHNSSF